MAYQSFVITATKENPAIDQFIEKIRELVPNIKISEPLYCAEGEHTNSNAKSYIITHALDNSFKLVVTNQDKLLDKDGKPNNTYADHTNILVQIIVGEEIKYAGYIPVGEMYDSYAAGANANVIYITLVANDTYLLWNISGSAPSACVPLYIAYAPIYQRDGSVYGFIYPGMNAYVARESYVKYILTYKDTLLTLGKSSPNSKSYGLCLNIEKRFRYLEIDLTKPLTASNGKPTLTIKVPLYISIHYGDNCLPDDEYMRRINTNFYSRECFLMISYGQYSDYPMGSILTLDGKDYYVCKKREEFPELGGFLYQLFEL